MDSVFLRSVAMCFHQHRHEPDISKPMGGLLVFCYCSYLLRKISVWTLEDASITAFLEGMFVWHLEKVPGYVN